jgi:hypothetical protein
MTYNLLEAEKLAVSDSLEIKKMGPLSRKIQWGTVREDYSDN